MDSEGHFWHVILRVTSPALAANSWHCLLPQPYCQPDVSPSVHAAHMQGETHGTQETPVLTLCCSNRPCWGRREERFGVSRWGMLLTVMRGRLSTSHARWQGRTGMREQQTPTSTLLRRVPQSCAGNMGTGTGSPIFVRLHSSHSPWDFPSYTSWDLQHLP